MGIMDNFMLALEIMGLGMAGIFAVILVLMLAVWLLSKLPERRKEEEDLLP